MKKIFLLLLVTLGFSATSFAQEEKQTDTTSIEQSNISPFETKAKKNVADLKSGTKISADMEVSLFQLFKAKHKMIYNAVGSEERISTIKQGIEQKLKAVLGEATFNSVKSNTTLFESLMN